MVDDPSPYSGLLAPSRYTYNTALLMPYFLAR
jgi:hypothetical protein